MKVLANTLAVIILEHRSLSNQHIVYLKITQCYIIFLYKAVKKCIPFINVFVEILCEVGERHCNNYLCLVHSHSGEETEAHRG